MKKHNTKIAKSAIKFVKVKIGVVKVVLSLMFFVLFILVASTANSYVPLSEDAQCEANGINYVAAKTMVATLKTALKTHDKKTIASLMTYPLQINKEYKAKSNKSINYNINNEKQFIAEYAALFNPFTIKLILSGDEIFCNYQGGMVGNGAVWFFTKGDSGKIFVINKLGRSL